jgi:tripartite ATP-independent transporter DctP family solute receptor
MEIQIFPNNQLGGDTDMLSQLRSGAIQFFTLSGLILGTLVPVAQISGIGFAWKSYDDVWPALDGELGKLVRDAVEKVGLRAFERIWDNGFRQITSSTRAITKPADLKNFKIRVPPSPMWTSMFTAFGSAPVTINFAECYTALQTKVAEGQENPLAIIDTAKLYEVQKYLSMTNHMWDGFWFLANGEAWRKLPADLQEIVARRVNEAGLSQRADTKAMNETLAKQLASHGMIINATEAAPFRAQLKAAGYYDQWRQKFGASNWNILEKHAGALG